MLGRLTERNMDTLEQWIGTGCKKFTLLYAITRDGCNSQTFHQRCDNQGPTVTVLYNQQGSVYGGYTPASWRLDQVPQTYITKQNSIPVINFVPPVEYVNTYDSFLFQLQFNGSSKANKFTLKPGQNKYSILRGLNYGPNFGLNDLVTFYNTVPFSNGCFVLNGRFLIGNVYDNQGIAAAQINNGNTCVTELEVYSVSAGQRQVETQWRTTKLWSDKQLVVQLKQDIASFTPAKDTQVTEARILMMGPIGAGKSSYYNTVSSAFRGRISRRAGSGSTEQSLTSTYTPYKVRMSSGLPPKFRLCDTRGLEESAGLTEVDCNYLLDGNIPDHYQFGSTPITPKTPGFKLDPKPNDQIHCVVFVFDSTTLEVLSPKLVQKKKRFQVMMNEKGIPQLLLLTKVDRLCKDVEKDISFVYKSKTVEQNVEKAAQLFGLPRNNVLPVKNYEKETDLDENIDTLALIALKEILNCAEDYLDNLSDRN